MTHDSAPPTSRPDALCVGSG